MKTSESIPAVVKFHRKKSGLSQNQLAVLAGVGKTAIFDIESGKETVQLDTLKKVLHALNIEMIFQSQLMNEYRKQIGAGDEKS